MGVVSKLRAFFRGGTTSFMPLEKQVLDAVAQQLDQGRAAMLRQSVARINLVQRLDGGREVNTYEMRNGKPVLDEAPRLSESSGEAVLAEFSLSTSSGAQNRGKVWLVDGRFFSMVFEQPTEHMLDDRVEKLIVNLAC
jgi:hypothetical protein